MVECFNGIEEIAVRFRSCPQSYGLVVITVARDVRNVSVRIRLSAGPPVFKLVDSSMERFVYNEETCVRFAARSSV